MIVLVLLNFDVKLTNKAVLMSKTLIFQVYVLDGLPYACDIFFVWRHKINAKKSFDKC